MISAVLEKTAGQYADKEHGQLVAYTKWYRKLRSLTAGDQPMECDEIDAPTDCRRASFPDTEEMHSV